MDFLAGDIWKAFLFDLDEREKSLIELFKDNDQQWNPDTLRGKLTELDYMRELPKLIILSIIAAEHNKEKELDNEHNEETV